ncbi:hypothetical protein NPIL_311811 [Nephila pilipes]|uniref:Uncharacterized protein n=1 Tax=Nephila pilipes TaxID=299642 RepID=A0A8X6NPB8_NEPPI|nr:hypothetical protein NPIL_311811 [Nephila pilipes]
MSLELGIFFRDVLRWRCEEAALLLVDGSQSNAMAALSLDYWLHLLKRHKLQLHNSPVSRTLSHLRDSLPRFTNTSTYNRMSGYPFQKDYRAQELAFLICNSRRVVDGN